MILLVDEDQDKLDHIVRDLNIITDGNSKSSFSAITWCDKEIRNRKISQADIHEYEVCPTCIENVKHYRRT